MSITRDDWTRAKGIDIVVYGCPMDPCEPPTIPKITDPVQWPWVAKEHPYPAPERITIPESGLVPPPAPAATTLIEQARERLVEVERQIAEHDQLVLEREVLKKIIAVGTPEENALRKIEQGIVTEAQKLVMKANAEDKRTLAWAKDPTSPNFDDISARMAELAGTTSDRPAVPSAPEFDDELSVRRIEPSSHPLCVHQVPTDASTQPNPDCIPQKP